jgi:hypothetical protein
MQRRAHALTSRAHVRVWKLVAVGTLSIVAILTVGIASARSDSTPPPTISTEGPGGPAVTSPPPGEPDAIDCVAGTFTFTAPGQVSSSTGNSVVGAVLSASDPGSWNVCSDYVDSYNYHWLRDEVDIVGATNSAYTTTAADVGHMISIQVQAVDSLGDRSLYARARNGWFVVQTAQDTSVKLLDTSNPNYFVFQNGDGHFTIYRKCLGQAWWNTNYPALSYPANRYFLDTNLTVGPAYVARVDRREDNNGQFVQILDDVRPTDYRHGGLGTFGFHGARKVTPPAPAYFDERYSWAVDGRNCTPVGVDPTNSTDTPPTLVNGVITYDADVYLKDNQNATDKDPISDLITVHYHYEVQSSQIELWTTVTEYVDGSGGSSYNDMTPGLVYPAFVKEPKFQMKVANTPYKRMIMYDNAGNPSTNAFSGGPGNPCAFLGVDPSTGQCDADTRYRAAYDYGTSTTSSSNCPTPIDTCLNIIAQSVDPGAGSKTLWENAISGTPCATPCGGGGVTSGFGLDRWESYVWNHTCTTWQCPIAQQFAPTDTAGDPNTHPPSSIMWACHLDATPPSTPEQYNRRWEMGAPDKNAYGYLRAAILLKGWDGGSGGPDCEPLSWHDNNPGINYKNYFSISFGATS